MALTVQDCQNVRKTGRCRACRARTASVQIETCKKEGECAATEIRGNGGTGESCRSFSQLQAHPLTHWQRKKDRPCPATEFGMFNEVAFAEVTRFSELDQVLPRPSSDHIPRYAAADCHPLHTLKNWHDTTVTLFFVHIYL